MLPKRIYQLSENAITVEFPLVISENLLNYISSYNNWLMRHPFPGFLSATQAYNTLTVFYDCVIVSGCSSLAGVTCFEKVSLYFSKFSGDVEIEPYDSKEIAIPVCYGKDFGPDLQWVSQHTGLTIAEIIARHTAPVYLVHMIGFIPGFAYLGGMDESLSSPRKEKVTPAIPPGAVGIAGAQTGVYPLQTPGGWQIIGRTPIVMFDINKSQPSLLKAGDKVKFYSISEQEFEQYNTVYAHPHS